MRRVGQESNLAECANSRVCPPQSTKLLAICRDDGTIPCAPPQGRALRVLIVDDCRDTADSLALLVTIWGHAVQVAYSGEAALEQMATYQPDVLLLDMAMPKMDGCQLAKQLRRQPRFKHTLLIATTGYTDEPHRLRGAAAGFDLHLVKPLELGILEDLLLREQSCLAASQATRSARARSEISPL